MNQSLPYDENKLDDIIDFEVISNTFDGSAIGYSVEVDLKKPDKTNQKRKNFHNPHKKS